MIYEEDETWWADEADENEYDYDAANEWTAEQEYHDMDDQ